MRIGVRRAASSAAGRAVRAAQRLEYSTTIGLFEPSATASTGRTNVWTVVWIGRPQLIPVYIGVCNLCRALTPPKHHRGARTGSGPGTGSSWWRDGGTRSSGEEDGARVVEEKSE